jgi:hypothetical protein
MHEERVGEDRIDEGQPEVVMGGFSTSRGLQVAKVSQ